MLLFQSQLYLLAREAFRGESHVDSTQQSSNQNIKTRNTNFAGGGKRYHQREGGKETIYNHTNYYHIQTTLNMNATEVLAITFVGGTGVFAFMYGFYRCWLSHSKQVDNENNEFPKNRGQFEDTRIGEDIELGGCHSAPSMSNKNKQHFLDLPDTWARARYLFPGLSEEQPLHEIHPNPVVFLLESIECKLYDLRETDEGELERLMKRENAVELCIALGLRESFVRKRYEAIDTLHRELGTKSKTPTMISIWHLLMRIGVNNSFGDLGHFDGIIRTNYKGKEWLSHLGVHVTRGSGRASVDSVIGELERQNIQLEKSYLHGTNGTTLRKMFRDNGRMFPSAPSKFVRHDFGSGVYCFKGELKHALSFAIDRSWPMFESDTNDVTKHNPSVVLFPKPNQFNRFERNRFVHDVAKKAPFRDKYLKKSWSRANFNQFEENRNSWSGTNQEINWKSFVKLARYYHKIPLGGKRLFFGFLHDCGTTHGTDQCNEPQIDRDQWIQYCFRDQDDLGTDRVFIEFNVDWHEWVENSVVDVEEAQKEMTTEMCGST